MAKRNLLREAQAKLDRSRETQYRGRFLPGQRPTLVHDGASPKGGHRDGALPVINRADGRVNPDDYVDYE